MDSRKLCKDCKCIICVCNDEDEDVLQEQIQSGNNGDELTHGDEVTQPTIKSYFSTPI